MGTVIYPALQSLLRESQLVEPRALTLRLSSPKAHFSSSLELALKPCDSSTIKLSDDAKCQYEEASQKANTFHNRSANTTPDSGGWSFLQALSTTSDDAKEPTEKQSTYVHPLVKRSSSTLSEKSLELCTENLGSETGTDIIEDNIFSLSQSHQITPSNEGNSPTREQKTKPLQLFGDNKKASSRSFPPPLTTMSGSKSIQVRPHREDGRLIIEAIKTPSTHTYFHAERSHGRLRLSFVKDSTPDFDSKNVTSAPQKTKEAEDIENDAVNYDDDQDEERQDEEIEEEEEVEDGNKMEVDGEMGMEEFQRPCGCKGELENHKGITSNWEPLWVATS